MPELPEVETIRRALEPVVAGRTVIDAWTFGTPKFAPAVELIGARVESVGRRGKYLLCELDDDRELAIHLGMTGGLSVRDADFSATHLRASWTLDDGVIIDFHDARRFGRVALVPRGDHRSLPTLHAIGPEPLSDDFDARDFFVALRRSGRAVKTQLLSQRPVAGVGNIYADEALWRACVHPAARVVTRPQAERLRDAIRNVLTEAIERRGTTLRDYRTFDGEPGENEAHLEVYGRAGEPCARCARPLRSMTLDARTTTYCGACQRRR